MNFHLSPLIWFVPVVTLHVSQLKNLSRFQHAHIFTSLNQPRDTNFSLIPAWRNHSRYKIDFNLKFLEKKVLKKIMWGGSRIESENRSVNKVPRCCVFIEPCSSLQVRHITFHNRYLHTGRKHISLIKTCDQWFILLYYPF
jgi:hypothetical protein